MLKSIHPFPARMASELALDPLKGVAKGRVVLDPMMGSGTVLRHAIAMGHNAIGFDMDPLAVLMTKVSTTPVLASDVFKELNDVIHYARSIRLVDVLLPWIDEDTETREFVNYWFAKQQRNDLRRIAFVLHERSAKRLGPRRRAAIDLLRLCLSRIIVTKDKGASLGRDISHSRPHRVSLISDYDVFQGFELAVHRTMDRLASSIVGSNEATVSIGDVRSLALENSSVDIVITSPPYLNAIDYLRGHRLALVWLGFTLGELRFIRSESIGAERAPDSSKDTDVVQRAAAAMCDRNMLDARRAAMVTRYADDLLKMCREIARVLKPGGTATFVVGNSCLKDVFIKNSKGVAQCAALAGLQLRDERERELPVRSRYLPLTGAGHLSKRMRTESVMTFEKNM